MNDILFVGEHSKTFDVQWHSHEHWEMVYCTGGQGAFRFDNGTIMTYKEGDVVAVPPRERHANTGSEGFTNIHLRMGDPSFSSRNPFRVADDQGQHLRVAFEQVKYYFLADIKRRELVLSALGQLISSYLIVYRSNAEFSEPVEQLRNQILRNYANAEFALDETIRAMPFHYDYLRKLFKKEMGITPLEYLTKLRMNKAESMLNAWWSKDYSVAEIAELCGYEDALYFSRVFKKYYGQSPTAYANRKRMDKDKANGLKCPDCEYVVSDIT